MTYKHLLDWLIQLHKICHFHSLERSGRATNSELRRWFERGSVEINGCRVSAHDAVPGFSSVVLHPKGKRRTTLW